MILCCGEALIDFVPTGRRLDAYKPCPGGSPYNVAVGLGRLQTPVGFFGKLSTDYFGDLLAQYLAQNGVGTHMIVRAAGPTTLAFVSLPLGGCTEPQFLFYSCGAVDRNLGTTDLPQGLPEDIVALHFGSISLVLEPGASSFEALMRRESRKRTLSLDPNVRPTLILDRAEYIKRLTAWIELVDIVRLSLADLDWLYPGVPAEDVVAKWLAAGPSLCIVTLGAQGARAFSAYGAASSVGAPLTPVADTVGAGDSFMAAVLAYLHQHGFLQARLRLRGISDAELQSCLRYACQAAAINCSRPGADPPFKREMDAWSEPRDSAIVQGAQNCY